MNLHGIVATSIGAINPLQSCTLQSSVGYTQAPDGSQQPIYATPVVVMAQIQPLSSTDLRQLAALNISRAQRKVYINGLLQGVNRPAVKGGDLITFPDATVWLVVQPLEQFPDWTSAAVTEQNGS